MRILPTDDAGIREALQILQSGGAIAHATETCYGLACDVRNPSAVAKLFAIKQRPKNQPVSVLFPSIDQAKKYVEWNAQAEELAKRHLPGPLTIILHIKPNSPTIFTTPFATKPKTRNEQTSNAGVRLSSHPLAQKLADSFGSPLSTTSANIHGRPNPYSAEEIAKQFENASAKPDLILDSGALPLMPPSTIIDCTSPEGKILRQ